MCKIWLNSLMKVKSAGLINININYLLTESEVYTGKSQTETL